MNIFSSSPRRTSQRKNAHPALMPAQHRQATVNRFADAGTRSEPSKEGRFTTVLMAALFALPVTGRDLSMISLVALIMLAGTVVNASIILVDYINVRRERGESREEAIVNACPLRVRPVLMTTITTVLAMVPMAFAMGETMEIMSDMGTTMMSGMIVSTVVTLFFTPVYYSLIDKLGEKLRPGKKKHNNSEIQPA